MKNIIVIICLFNIFCLCVKNIMPLNNYYGMGKLLVTTHQEMKQMEIAKKYSYGDITASQNIPFKNRIQTTNFKKCYLIRS